jgi:hypothetical protein
VVSAPIGTFPVSHATQSRSLAGTRTTRPLDRTISRTDGVLRTLAGGGTSVNTTGFFAGAPFTCSAPASRKTRRHHVSVLSGILRFSPNSRSVNPLRAQHANIPAYLLCPH